MKKVVFYVIMFVLIINSVIAANNVMVLNFEYDNGKITFMEKTIKPGYFPDNKLAPSQGYRLIEISDSDEVLYSFNFEVPRTIFTDTTTEYGEIKGNMIVLNKTSFALVVPYFENIKEIKILNENQKEVTSINLAPQLSPLKNSLLAFFLFALGVIIIVISLQFFKKHKHHK